MGDWASGLVPVSAPALLGGVLDEVRLKLPCSDTEPYLSLRRSCRESGRLPSARPSVLRRGSSFSRLRARAWAGRRVCRAVRIDWRGRRGQRRDPRSFVSVEAAARNCRQREKQGSLPSSVTSYEHAWSPFPRSNEVSPNSGSCACWRWQGLQGIRPALPPGALEPSRPEQSAYPPHNNRYGKARRGNAVSPFALQNSRGVFAFARVKVPFTPGQAQASARVNMAKKSRPKKALPSRKQPKTTPPQRRSEGRGGWLSRWRRYD